MYIFHDKFNDLLNLTLQMTVVEAYVGRKKISPPEDRSQLQNEVSSLLDEGVALNTSGSVFVSKVFPRFVYFASIFVTWLSFALQYLHEISFKNDYYIGLVIY